MPEPPRLGDLDAEETQVFFQVVGQLDALREDVSNHSSAAAGQSGPVFSGGMAEGDDFCRAESEARTMLGQFLADTQRGIQGYQSAVGNIGREYENVIALNDATMRRLLQADSVPAAVDPRFQHPEINDAPPATPTGGS